MREQYYTFLDTLCPRISHVPHLKEMKIKVIIKELNEHNDDDEFQM
jgi:hypothetical protein